MGFHGFDLQEIVRMLAKEAARKGYAVQVKFMPIVDISSLDSKQKIEIFEPDTEDDLK